MTHSAQYAYVPPLVGSTNFMETRVITVRYVPDGFESSQPPYGDGPPPIYFTRPCPSEAAAYFRSSAAGVGSEWLAIFAGGLPMGEPPELLGTQLHRGAVAAWDGLHATYHDGAWTRDRGADRIWVQGQSIGWDRTRVHSITLTSPESLIAVRGSTSVTREQLIKVAASVQFRP